MGGTGDRGGGEEGGGLGSKKGSGAVCPQCGEPFKSIGAVMSKFEKEYRA